MLRVKDVLPVRETWVEGDHYIDLVVEWPTGRSGHSFTFGLDGAEGGHVEFEFDRDSGSLRRFVLLSMPPVDDSLTEPPGPTDEGHLVIHPGLAPYTSARYAKTTFGTRLCLRDLGDRLLLRLFGEPVSRYVTSGGVRFGLTADIRIATLSAPKSDPEKGLSI